MDSIKGKVEKVTSNRKRLLELKEEVLRLEKIIKESEEANDGNLCEEEYGGLKMESGGKIIFGVALQLTVKYICLKTNGRSIILKTKIRI